MHRQTAAAITAISLPLGALTGCGEEAKAEKSSFSVASGVEHQYSVLADELAEKGDTVKAGEWTVNLIVEAAEPWYQAHGKHQQFREPADGETNHVEIIPVESATGRIVPDVPVTVEVVDDDGKVVQKMPLDFYYSTFYHYANNFSIPTAGDYTLRVTLGVPDFKRHGEEDQAPALAEGTTVEFENVALGVK